MAYLQSSDGQEISHELIQEMATLIGLSIPEKDLGPLAAALRDQLASMRLIEELDLSGVAPVLRFDPRWHD